MWQLKADWIIPQIVDQFLDRNYESIEELGKSEKYPAHTAHRFPGMAFKIRMRVDEYSETEDTKTLTDNGLLLFCRGTSVFYAVESQIRDIIEHGEKLIEFYINLHKQNKIHKFALDRKVAYITQVLKTKHKEMPMFDVTTIDPEWWRNSSNHDSCWRSDGLSWLSERYFEMCKEVNDDVAPASLSTDVDFGFGKVFENVYIDMISDPDNPGGYHRRIINITRVPKKQ